MDCKNRIALVTGASSGLGAAFARDLAARGCGLVLSARSAAPMESLADELRRRHGVKVVVEPLDLAELDAAATLAARLDAQHVAPDILINNAGFGLGGSFLEQNPDQLAAMLQVDVVALTQLTRLFGARMAARGQGHILLIASLASYQPSPGLAAYSAAKAYVRSLGEALNVEFAPKVSVTTLSPGLMDTQFNQVSGFRPLPLLDATKLSPERVARIGLDALFAGRSSLVAGWLNSAAAFSNRFVSSRFAAKQALRMAQR